LITRNPGIPAAAAAAAGVPGFLGGTPMRRRTWAAPLIIGLTVFSLILSFVPATAAATDEDKTPERDIMMSAEYPGVVVPKGEEVSMDLIFNNRGRKGEDVAVWVSETPDGWKAKIKTYRFTITGVHVPPDDTKRVTFEAIPEEKTGHGDYRFRVEAKTQDGRFRMARDIRVTVTEETEADTEDRGVKLTTSYPEIQGPSDARFEFSLEMESKLDKDAVFNLFAQGPNGWDINFKPAYESKYITGVRMKANQSKTLAVEVKPAVNAKAGEYPVLIRVSSGDAKAEAQLRVILTGTYGLEVGTLDGLLSLDARQGKPSNVSFYVKNTGSAANHDIKFLSFKPENWKVEFTPERIDIIEPGELKQVEVVITPYEEALVGDYSVSVTVEGEKATKSIEFRTTVKASAAWGWIGIGIIVLVIVGLFGLFRMLGRR